MVAPHAFTVDTFFNRAYFLFMTEAEFVDLLKREQGDRSLRAYAKHLGFSVAYISDVYKGRRAPGPLLVKFFGLERQRTVTTIFVRRKK